MASELLQAVTAGASAPEDVVQECVAYLIHNYGATVETRTIREEDVSFQLPKELRSLTRDEAWLDTVTAGLQA